jgi:acetyl esterase
MTGARLLLRLPEPVQRAIAGRPIEVDGRRLALTAQVLIRVARWAPFDVPHRGGSIGKVRRELDQAGLLAGATAGAEVKTRDVVVPGPGGPLRTRIYEPDGFTAPAPSLVYFHGGGFVLGSIDTHDGACRILAKESGVQVISVNYRLAPEHPFPAAPQDAVAAFRYVAEHAGEFGADRARLAVGGDSSGANLAAVVSHAATRGEGPLPAFTLLIAPATDAVGGSPSHRKFASGFRLDRDEWQWYRTSYITDPAEYTDPRASVLHDDSVGGLPPTYVATCGFDLLRDEGEAYAKKLEDAGVPVIFRCHGGQLHGYVNRAGFDPDALSALVHDAGVLRAGVGLSAPVTTEIGPAR